MPELKNDLYDLSMLFEQVGSDNNLLKKFIDIFLSTVPEDMVTLKNAIDWEEYDTAKSAAHKMKSSYSIMGASWAHQLCMHIEEIAKTRQETEKLPEIFEELSDKFDKMVIALQQITF